MLPPPRVPVSRRTGAHVRGGVRGPHVANMGDVCMHLTNYAVNKRSEGYVRNDRDASSSTAGVWRPRLQALRAVVPLVGPGGVGGGCPVRPVVEDRGHLRAHHRERPTPPPEGAFDHIQEGGTDDDDADDAGRRSGHRRSSRGGGTLRGRRRPEELLLQIVGVRHHGR